MDDVIKHKMEGRMKCQNCGGYGFVRILNEADEIVEMECPYCGGTGWRTDGVENDGEI